MVGQYEDSEPRKELTSDYNPEVVDQIELTEAVVDDLEVAVGRLISRLDPVVNHTLTSSGVDCEPDRAKLAPLAERISNSNDRIRALTSNVNYTLPCSSGLMADHEEETTQEVTEDLLPILAAWLGIEPERVKGFVVAIESDLGMSSAWSVNLPIWHLLAMTDELKYTLQQQREV